MHVQSAGGSGDGDELWGKRRTASEREADVHHHQLFRQRYYRGCEEYPERHAAGGEDRGRDCIVYRPPSASWKVRKEAGSARTMRGNGAVPDDDGDLQPALAHDARELPVRHVRQLHLLAARAAAEFEEAVGIRLN
jgi:hypothetical protein